MNVSKIMLACLMIFAFSAVNAQLIVTQEEGKRGQFQEKYSEKATESPDDIWHDKKFKE